MVSAAKMAVAADSTLLPSKADGEVFIPLNVLEDDGYLEKLKDPDGSDYARLVNATASGTVPTSGSYVKIKKASTGNTFTYEVYLGGSKRSIGTAAAPVDVNALGRGEVDDNPAV